MAPASALPCPICQRPVTPTLPTYPFCSVRCQQVDLVRWADGKYTIARDVTGDDLEKSATDDLARGEDGDHDVA